MTETISGPRQRLGRAVALALGISIAVTAQAGLAAADGAEAIHYSFKGEVAQARFRSLDPSGCVATDTFVQAVEGRVKQEGRPDSQSMAFVTHVKYDVCSRQPLMFATGFADLSSGGLEIDRLQGASLTTTVNMYNPATGDSFPLDVQLQWTGVGETSRSREHIMVDYPGFRLNSRESGTRRAADVTGVISDGLVNHASGWSYGSLSSVMAGDTIVIR